MWLTHDKLNELREKVKKGEPIDKADLLVLINLAEGLLWQKEAAQRTMQR